MLGSSVKLYILWAKFWSVFPWQLGRPKHGALEVQEHWIKFLGMDPISAAQLVVANCWLQGEPRIVIRTCLKRNRLFQPYGLRAWYVEETLRARQVEGLRAQRSEVSEKGHDQSTNPRTKNKRSIYIIYIEYLEFRHQNFGIGMFASMLRFF